MDVKRLRDGTKITQVSKAAAIGGEQEQQFEQSFASLAYAFVVDKAPALLDYLIGFQLVDRNDDNTKAVGIFGFKIGESWVYAPVFFINGDLKGHELLYLKSQDSFVPMKENWVNYIINRRPHILGEGTPGSPDQLGVLQPDIQTLSQPPESGKFASLQQPNVKAWAKNAGLLKFLGDAVTTQPREKDANLHERLDLREFLSQSPELVKLALRIREEYPVIKEAMTKWYGSDVLKEAVLSYTKAAKSDIIPGGLADNKSPGSKSQKAKGTKVEYEHTNSKSMAKEIAEDHLAEDPKYYNKLEKMESGKCASILSAPQPVKRAAADPEDAPKVEVITEQVITENGPEMTESEQEKLLREGYLIRDHRNGDEVSVVYNTQVEMDIMNPDVSGRYDVLTEEGKFDDCLVIHHPHGERGRLNQIVVVRMSDGNRKACKNFRRSNVFVKVHPQQVKSETSEWREWFNTLSDSTDLDVNANYVVVTQDGDGTCEFTVEKDLGDGNYEVWWHDYCSSSCDYDADDWHVGNGSFPESRKRCDCISFGSREGTTIKSYNGYLHLPPDSKVVRTKASPKCRKCDKTRIDCCCDYFSEKRDDSPPVIRPGDLASLQMGLLQKSASSILNRGSGDGLFPLKVWSDGHEVVIDSNRMSKLAGLVALVSKYGLREKQAKRLIKDAELGRQNRYWLKLANPYQSEIGPYATMEGQGMPMDTGAKYTSNQAYGSVPIQEYDQGRFMEVPGMGAGQTDPSTYDPMQNIDPHAMQTAQNAFQQNQKEVFDTAMISSMLNAVRQDSLIDRYLGDLTKALDRLGRILFLFYWHNEEFSERYGKQDLPELEDTIRNAFEGLGDLTLFLKQKTVEPLSFGEPTLSETAGD